MWWMCLGHDSSSCTSLFALRISLRIHLRWKDRLRQYSQLPPCMASCTSTFLCPCPCPYPLPSTSQSPCVCCVSYTSNTRKRKRINERKRTHKHDVYVSISVQLSVSVSVSFYLSVTVPVLAGVFLSMMLAISNHGTVAPGPIDQLHSPL